MPYRVEISPNNRALCQDGVCKHLKVKLAKGEMRLGTWTDIQDHGSWKWRHWGCVSGQVLKNLRDFVDPDSSGEYSFDFLDGFDEIEEGEAKDKIRRAITQGHIDPQDFRGEPEFNVLGKKGIRSAQKAKRLKFPGMYESEEAEPAEPAEPVEPVKKAKTKPAKSAKTSSKRSKAVADEEEDKEEVQKPNKRAKTALKPNKVAAAQHEELAPAPKKGRGRVKAVKVTKKEESDVENEDVEPVPSVKVSKPAKDELGGEARGDEDEEPLAKTGEKKKASSKASKSSKAVKAVKEGSDNENKENNDESEKPASKTKEKKKTAKTKKATEPSAGTLRRSGRAVSGKKAIVDQGTADEDEQEKAPPKTKRRSKKVEPKATDRQDAQSDSE